jgi:hypothetical protein
MMRRACRVTPSASACRGRIGRAQIDLPALCPGRRPFTPLPFVNGHKSGPTPRRPPERKTWLLLSPALKYGCLAPDVPVNWRSALRQFPLRHPRPASQNRTRRRVKGAARCAIGAHRRKRLDHKSLRGLVLRRLRFARRSIACGPPQFARLTALPQRYEKYGCHSVSSVFACRSTQLLPLRQKWRGLTKNRYQAGIRLIANNCCQRLY